MVKLSRAFKLRTQLTKAYEEQFNKVNDSAVFYNKDTEKKTDVEPMVDELDKIQDMLATLNEVIDRANANTEARKFLIAISLKKKSLIHYVGKANKETKFTPTVKRYDEYLWDEVAQSRGKYVEDKYELNAHEKYWEELAKKTKKEISDLEDKIAEINASTDVDIPADILQYIDRMYSS